MSSCVVWVSSPPTSDGRAGGERQRQAHRDAGIAQPCRDPYVAGHEEVEALNRAIKAPPAVQRGLRQPFGVARVAGS